MELRWEKAPYGRRAWFVDVTGGRYLVEYARVLRKWTVKLNGTLRAKCDARETAVDFVAIEVEKAGR